MRPKEIIYISGLLSGQFYAFCIFNDDCHFSIFFPGIYEPWGPHVTNLKFEFPFGAMHAPFYMMGGSATPTCVACYDIGAPA